MNARWPMTDAVVSGFPGRTKRRRRTWTPDERRKLSEMWNARAPIEEMCAEFDCDEGRIYSKAHQMGLPRRSSRSKRGRKTAGRSLRADPTGQRRKTRVGKTSGPHVSLESHDPRLRSGITIFPTSVVPVSKLPRLLKSGHNSYKIGKELTKGRWKGQRLFTLTLEERATCPRNCLQWATCYGNNMPFAQRIFDDGLLTRRLWGELAALSAEFPAGFIVRLHVLGDFYSLAYVEFWRQALIDFPALNIFGFTARTPPDPIGVALVEVAATFYDRFRVRFSGVCHAEDCAEVVERAEDARFVLCPAEGDPDRSCATCGLCMNSNVSISFVRH